MEKKYELRSPKADDMFLMFRILSKVGVKNLKNCFSTGDVMAAIRGDGKKDSEAVGLSVALEIASVLMEHLDDAKKDIYAFLSNLSGMKAADIASLEMADFAQMVIEVIQLEGFRDFFQRVFGLLK